MSATAPTVVLTAIETKAERDRVRTRLRTFFQTLPADRDVWLTTVMRVAKDRTNIPGLNRDVRFYSHDMGRTIPIKTLRDSSLKNGFSHFKDLRELTRENQNPPWFEDLITLMARPAMRGIDLPLALLIVLREIGNKSYGRMNSKSSQNRIMDSREKGGLDFLWKNRWRYLDDDIVPQSWIDDLSRGDGHGSAKYVARRGMGWHFARLAMTGEILLRRTDKHYRIGDTAQDAEALFRSIPPLERRMWFALAFQAYNGRDKNLATMSPAGLGVIPILRALSVLNLPLAAISQSKSLAVLMRKRHALERRFQPEVQTALIGPRAERLDAIKFLNKLHQFHRFRLGVKTAIMAQALDELQGSA